MKGVFSGEKQTKAATDAAERAMTQVNGNKFKDAVKQVISNGAAVMFATTRDGSSIVVTLMNGNERGKVYCSSLPELEEALQDLVRSFT